MKYILGIILLLLLCMNAELIVSPFLAKSTDYEVKEITYDNHDYLIFIATRTGQFTVLHSSDCHCYTDYYEVN